MADKWQLFHEWSGEIQDHLRTMDAKLDRIIRLLGEGHSDVESLRQDHEQLAEQVQKHERKIAAIRRDTP